jgi:hypothetical protein
LEPQHIQVTARPLPPGRKFVASVFAQAGEATRAAGRGAQQAQPPAWIRIGDVPGVPAGVPLAPRRGADIRRGEGAAQVGQDAGRSDSAIGRHAWNGPQSSHAYS